MNDIINWQTLSQVFRSQFTFTLEKQSEGESIPSYEFFQEGVLILPVTHAGDNTSQNLVLIRFNDSEIFAFLTTRMMVDAKQQISPRFGYHMIMLLENMTDESESYLRSRFMNWLPYGYAVDSWSWQYVFEEMREMHLRQYNELTSKNATLKSQIKRDNSKQKLQEARKIQQELKTQIKELKTEKEALKTRRNWSQDSNGYVYLLRVINTDNLYKIGRTIDPDNRYKTFKSKLPFQVEYEHLIQTDDMYVLESELHQKFASKRQNGSEFFALSPEDISYIKSL